MENQANKHEPFSTEFLPVGLLQARESRQLTLKQTSQMLGIPVSRLRNYEEGKYTPSLPEMEALSYFYGLPLAALLQPEMIKEIVRKPDAENLQQLVLIRQHIIANRLKIAFEQSGKSARELARSTKLSHARVQNYLHNRMEIPFDDLACMCQALNLDMGTFFDRESPLGKWQVLQSHLLMFAALPQDMQHRLVKEKSSAYTRVAARLMELEPHTLQALADALGNLLDLQRDEGEPSNPD